jgi:hypothetical protein
MVTKRETQYQAYLVDRLEEMFPGCFVTKNNEKLVQGIPDLLILHGGRWAMLEVKVSEYAPVRPNQPHYVEKFNSMSFAAFIYPENEEEVLDALQRSFDTCGSPCVPRS